MLAADEACKYWAAEDERWPETLLDYAGIFVSGPAGPPGRENRAEKGAL